MRASVAGRVAGATAVVAAVLLGSAVPARAEPGPELSVPEQRLEQSLSCTAGTLAAEPVLLVPGTFLTPETNYAWNYERVLAR